MYKNRLIKTGLLLIALAVLPASHASGQIIYGQPASADVGFIYTHWSIEDELDINQFMIPINGFVPLKDNLEAQFSAASSSSKAEAFGFDRKLSGLSDVRLQLNQSLAEDRVLLSLGLNLPTGKKELTFYEELLVIQTLSLNFLEFPVRQLGEGFGFNLMAGAAEMLGEVKVGGALMYQFNGKYTPYNIGDEYDPGDQLSLIGNADFTGDKYSIMVNTVYSIFTDDKSEDAKIFKQAPVLNLNLSGLYGDGELRFGGNIGLLLRGRNAKYDSTETKIEQLKAYGDEYFLVTRLIWIPDKKWKMTPSLQIHVIGENEYGIEGATVYGFGGDIVRNIGEGIDFGLGLRYFTGEANEFIDLSLSGYQISGSLMTSF